MHRSHFDFPGSQFSNARAFVGPRTRRIWAVVLLGLLVACTNAALGQQPEKVRSVEGITEYRLENGLQVLLFPDPSRPTVTVNLTVLVGSRHEGYGEAGMAHLLEHMVFKGTPSHPNVPKALQDRGADFNGTTSGDRTNYYETLPASDENLEFAIRLEADRLVNSFIKADDLASEMTVVRNEFERGENQPIAVLFQRIAAAAYEWHNYGKSTIGNRSDIERVPIFKLRDFYRRFYQPDNVVLLIAGKFDEEKALELVQKYFGAIPRPKRSLDRTYTEEPAQDGERSVILKRVGDVGVAAVAYHIPAGPHPDFAAIAVLDSILSSAPTGRLYKALVESKKATSVFAFAQPKHDPGLMLMFAQVRKDGSLEGVRDTMIAEIEGIGSGGVTDEEVERAVRKILKNRELAQSDTSSIAVNLSNWTAQGDWRLYFLYRDRIEKVTADDVQRVAKQYFRPNNRTVGLFIPTAEPEKVAVPWTPNVQELLADYKGRQVEQVASTFDASPRAIEERTTRDRLPGGLKLALLPKETRGKSVQLQLTLRFGDPDSLKGMETAASFLPRLMTRGTAEMNRQQLEDELDRLQARLVGGGSPFGLASFQVETKRDNLLEVVDLLRQVVREPALDQDELEIMRRRQLALIESSRTEPRAIASNALSRKLSPYPKDFVRYVPTFDERHQRVESLTLDQVKELYNGFFGAEVGEIAVVGDFEPKDLVPVLSEAFDGWKAKKSFARVPSKAFMDVSGGIESFRTPGKANANYSAAMAIEMRDDDPDYPAMVIGNFILGGGSLSSRLGNRVRQQEGLSYGVGSMFSAHPIDTVATLRMIAISNPQNIPRVVEVIREELVRLLKDGITEGELAQAKQGYLQSQQVGRTDDGTLASMLSNSLYVDRTMSYYAELEKNIEALTTDDVVQALRKHIDPDRLIVVTAGDFPE